MEKEEKILFLGGRWNCFSNFSSYAISWNNESWMTSEHVYQAEKFTDEKIKSEIKSTKSAYDAKMIANKYKDQIKSGWDDEKRLKIMEMIIRAKLEQHPHIRKKLLETGDREIIENSKDDFFWGWGENHTGLNYHGKIWMKLREEIG